MWRLQDEWTSFGPCAHPSGVVRSLQEGEQGVLGSNTPGGQGRRLLAGWRAGKAPWRWDGRKRDRTEGTGPVVADEPAARGGGKECR